MAKNLAQIRVIVQDYIDDTTIDPDQHIIDSVNHLSNVFSIRSVDTSQETIIGEASLEFPTASIKIVKVLIAGEVINELESLDNLQYNIDNSFNKWYIADDQIKLIQEPTAEKATEIHFDKGFKVPVETTTSDVPSRYLEMVYIGAVYRYYHKLVSKVILNRQDYPDVSPKEIRAIRDSWKKQYFDLIDEIKKNVKAL